MYHELVWKKYFTVYPRPTAYCQMQPPEVFSKKGVLRNFTKFTGKHLCLRPTTSLKRDSGTGAFLWIFLKFLRTPFLWNTSGGCFWTVNWISHLNSPHHLQLLKNNRILFRLEWMKIKAEQNKGFEVQTY